MMTLQLRNPHSILAALAERPADVLDVRLPGGGGAEAWVEVEHAAAAAGVPVRAGKQVKQERPGNKARGRTQNKTGREGGGEARVREKDGVPLHELFVEINANEPSLWLALDCLQDPHNVGAIMRTAAFFGVRGVIMTVDRAAPLTATAYDTAAGGIEYLDLSFQNNLARSLEAAKEAGIWVLGTSEHAELELDEVDRERPWLLVIGNEGRGMRRLTSEHCDTICRITPRGGVTSLNASVAAGIMISHLS
jgi:23S rRNA (guanosine2251-2'-O)-methyltransferase